MSLLQQLAKECFNAGRPLEELVAELVEKEYNQTLFKCKGAIRAGITFHAVVNSLVHSDGLPVKTATSLVFEAQDQVSKELAEDARFKKATDEAIALYKNGVRQADVVCRLKGFAPELAEKIAADNKQYYRA
jgi:hypothetical protein